MIQKNTTYRNSASPEPAGACMAMSRMRRGNRSAGKMNIIRMMAGWRVKEADLCALVYPLASQFSHTHAVARPNLSVYSSNIGSFTGVPGWENQEQCLYFPWYFPDSTSIGRRRFTEMYHLAQHTDILPFVNDPVMKRPCCGLVAWSG